VYQCQQFPNDPSRPFSLGRIGQLASWLNRRTCAQAWGLVLATVLIVSPLDFATYDFELCIATLYIVPIALACWQFGARAGIGATVAVTLIAVAKYPVLHTHPTLLTTIWNGVARATAFSILAAIVLAFRHSLDYVQFLANRDRMTGALNKEAFEHHIGQQLDLARASQTPMLLAFLDLDGFKAVNDRYGHEAGDGVLQRFSEGTAGELRNEDCFGRVGGDEFAMLLPLPAVGRGKDIAKDLHRRLSAILASTGYPVTCSMGALLVHPSNDYSRAELMREADRLMYSAKHSGKNRLMVGSTATFPELLRSGYEALVS
jgi:diguanylate cyclase (GGDEF)-like protein